MAEEKKPLKINSIIDTSTPNKEVKIVKANKKIGLVKANKEVGTATLQQPETQKNVLKEEELIDPDTKANKKIGLVKANKEVGTATLQQPETQKNVLKEEELIDSDTKEVRIVKANKLDSPLNKTKIKQKKLMYFLIILISLVSIIFYLLFQQYSTTISSQSITIIKRPNKNPNKIKPTNQKNSNSLKNKSVLLNVPISPNIWGIEISKGYSAKQLPLNNLIGDELTIELWINIREKLKSNVPLISLKNNNLIIDELFITPENRIGFFSFAKRKDAFENMYINTVKKLKVSATENYHIAVTKNNTSSSIYINGFRVNKHIFLNNETLPRLSLSIIDRLESSYTNGIILDEIRVSNKELYRNNFVPSRRLDYDKKTTVFYAPCEYTKNQNSKFTYWNKNSKNDIQLNNISWVNLNKVIRETNNVLNEMKKR